MQLPGLSVKQLYHRFWRYHTSFYQKKSLKTQIWASAFFGVLPDFRTVRGVYSDGARVRYHPDILPIVECVMHLLIRYNQVSKSRNAQQVITARHDSGRQSDGVTHGRGSALADGVRVSLHQHPPRNYSLNPYCRNRCTPTNNRKAYQLKKKRRFWRVRG